LRGSETACHLSILQWQDLVAPSLASRAQEVVNDQIGSNYDVYLGVFWTRIGTPTGVADSGSVEEFELALERAQQAGRPRIAALFKKAPIDPTAIDPQQLQKVQDFKARLGDMGAFYREFSDSDSLRNIVNLLFEQVSKDALHPEQRSQISSAGNKSSSANQPSSNDENDDEDDEGAGLLEVGEQFGEATQRMMSLLGSLGAREEANTDTLRHCSEEISTLVAIGNFDPAVAKANLSKASASLRSLSEFYDEKLDELEDIFPEMSRLIETDLRLRLEFVDPVEAAGDNISSMRELAATLGASIGQMDELIASTKQLPPLSAELRKARNRIGKSRERLKSMLVSLKERIEKGVKFFEENS
jgi:hypothetical protein